MAHVKSMYLNPELFRPERFLDENGNLNGDDLVLAYGFGKR
jgi:cytochrome P450